MRHRLSQPLPPSPSPSGNDAPESPEEHDEAAPFFHFGDGEGLFPPSDFLELDFLEALTGGPSLASPPRPSIPQPHHRLKAAAAARLNRQKKKQYVSGLESRLQSLASENRRLEERNRGLCRRLRGLEREAGYLRAVLANQSALARLLGRLLDGGAPGIRIRNNNNSNSNNRKGFFGGSDHDYALPGPEGGEEDMEDDEEDMEDGWATSSAPPSLSPPSSSGICLHLDQGQVSVEFCSICARRAATFSLAGASSSSSSPPSSSSASSSSSKM